MIFHAAPAQASRWRYEIYVRETLNYLVSDIILGF